MPWCPKCEEEYIEGVKNCSVCNENLIIKPQLSIEDKVQKQAPQFFNSDVFLFDTDNQVDFSLTTNALMREGIPFKVLEKGSGQYVRIYLGFNVTGKEVYVAKHDYEHASEICTTILSAKQELSEETDLHDEGLTQELVPYLTRKKVVIWSIRIVLSAIIINAVITYLFVMPYLLFGS